jgi:hypothetical protein
MWEALLLAIIGEQFSVGNEVCGAVISCRYNEDIVAVWNRNADNEEAVHRIREVMRQVMNLPKWVKIEYKRHDTSGTHHNMHFHHHQQQQRYVWMDGWMDDICVYVCMYVCMCVCI